MRTVKIGPATLTRLVTGSNPFSGFSHQGPDRDQEMLSYYTFSRIKETLRLAEAAGIDTVFARTDKFMTRLMQEYWAEGGRIQWFAQTATELGDQVKAARDAARSGAKGVYLHGGIVDYWYAQKQQDKLADALKSMRDTGVAAGFAGHTVEVHTWIRDHLDVDFQMCCYYDPSPRADNPAHVSTTEEKWDVEHRDRMAALIQTITKPVVHYKVFAGGNRPVQEGFDFMARTMRPGDVACIGHYVRDNPDMFRQNVALFDRVVEKRAK
jgi:hypothetical protein